jgi:hypothetical protein
MSKSDSTLSVTPNRARGGRSEDRVAVARHVEQEISSIKCSLACASFALGSAQDTEDGELGARAWWVIDECVERLSQLEVAAEDFAVDPSSSRQRGSSAGTPIPRRSMIRRPSPGGL